MMSSDAKSSNNLVRAKSNIVSGSSSSSKTKIDVIKKKVVETSIKNRSNTNVSKMVKKTSSSQSKSVEKTVTKTRQKKVYTLAGQKFDVPEEREPLRIFYESLSKQIPSSEMAEFWLMEHGLLSPDKAKKAFEKKQKKQKQIRMGTPVKSPPPYVSSGKPESSKRPQQVVPKNGEVKAKKRIMNESDSDDDDFVLSHKRRKGRGPFLGLVIPNTFEMNPLLQHQSYKPSNLTIDFAGRRFRFGSIAGEKVVLVMTGLAMINAGITTQLLLSLFNVKGVVHYGIAGNANPSHNIGDVVIPYYWAHTALWNWQRYGDGPENALPLEAFGDYTRDIGYINIGNYSTSTNKDNLLNNVWYQPEEIFPVDGTPEQRQHRFWVPVDANYFNISKRLQGMMLEDCINSTLCLSTQPKVTRVSKGASANIYLDNAAYRQFLYSKFNVSPIDMESAAVALICHQQKVPFITFRALSDLAGGGSAQSNEADIFTPLAANNSVAVVVEFIRLLSS